MSSHISRSLRIKLMATVAVSTILVVPAVAQEGQQAKTVEKVTVTGSRIKQRDFKSISPIATVGAKEIALTGTVNTEELLNTLPQIIPGVTITSNNPSLNGFATADLRGLGAGRTLVLINGRRANPSSAGGLVDLNTIPAGLISRVEVISGGASAVYGADAVAGAINFILRDDFEGIQIDSSYSQAEDGAAPVWTAGGILGGKFAGDRGSIQLGLQYASRSPVLATERDFARVAGAVLRVNNAARADNGTIFVSTNPADLSNPDYSVTFSGGSGTAPWGSITGVFSAANVTTVFGTQPDNDCRPSNGSQTTGNIRFRTGGGIAPFQNCAVPADLPGTPDAASDRYNFAPDNFLILGNERLNTSMLGKYDIKPNGEMQAFVETFFTNSRSLQQLAATPAAAPATAIRVKWDLDPTDGVVVVNPYVTGQPQLLALALLQFPGAPAVGADTSLDNRAFDLNIRTTQVGNRLGDIETNAIGSTQGFRGTIPSLDWDWEIYHSYARNQTTVKNDNNIGKTAMTQLLNACNTTSLAAQPIPLGALPNCPFPTSTSPGAVAFVPSATANNPLGVLALSQAMIDFVKVNTTDTIVYERTMFSANASGDIVDLWGEGAISAAIGAEYREEELDSRVDPFKAAGDIIGFNSQKSIAGSYDVFELYAEAQVPLLTGETLFENLSLVGGYRKSDYSTGADVQETWKYGAEWSPFAWLTFRAVENHAVRAPSAFELFRAGDQNFPAYVDPCDKDTFTASNPSCNAWFAQFGGAFVPGVYDQPNAQTQSFQFGNSNLQPEIADTLTYGVVFNPDWWPVGRLGVSVDRYEIEIDNQIGQRGISQIVNGCRDAIIANGNVFPVGNEFCDAVTRDAAGNISGINQSLANFASLSNSTGYDVNLKWSWDMEEDIGLPGTFAISTLYTYVDDADGSQGTFGGSIGGVTPEHKAATSFNYDVDDWSFLLRWTYLSGANDLVFGSPCAAPGPSCNSAAGLYYQAPLEAYNMYDFGGAWNVTESVQFSFGVDNILDEQPPVWPGAVGNGQFNTDGSTYDQLGRSYRVGLRWKQ